MDMFSYLLGKSSSGGSSGGVNVEIGENEYGKYAKFDNGLLIQAGQVVVPSGITYTDLTLPIAYKSADDYEVLSTPYYGGSSYGGTAILSTITASQKTDGQTGYIYAAKYSNTANVAPMKMNWISFGFWK